MRVILHVKDGSLSNWLALLLLLGLTAFSLWWACTHDPLLIVFGSVLGLCWLYVSWILLKKILRRRSWVMGIENKDLVWLFASRNANDVTKRSIPLQSLRVLEIVFPNVRWEAGVRDYVLAEVFLIDVHGNRHQIPRELLPGIFFKKISSCLQVEVPALRIMERMDNSSNSE